MSRVTKDLGDMEVSITHGVLHGLPVVHEVRRQKQHQTRSVWYVEGMALLRARPALRQRMRACVHTDGQSFEKEVLELSASLAAQ